MQTFVQDDGDFYSEIQDGQNDRVGSVICREHNGEIGVYWTEEQYAEELEMLSFVKEDELLRIFPMSISSRKLRPCFRQVKELQLEEHHWAPYRHSDYNERFGLLQASGLPKDFSGVYAFGVGIKRDYRGFVHLIESETSCTTVRFARSGAEGVSEDGKVFTVTYKRFSDYCRMVRRNKGRGTTAVARVLAAETHNVLAGILGVDTKVVKYGINPTLNAMTEEVEHGFVTTPADRGALIDHVTREAAIVAEENPERFYKLRSDIELVSLDTLIEKFETDLSRGFRNNERHWQGFFEANPFALQQLFAMPLVVIQREAEVKSADVTGSGNRIADFLCANTATRAAMVVEIKTPGAKLMKARPYRGEGASAVFAADPELSGAYAQLQSQMESVQADLPARLQPTDDLNPWGDIRGAIIIGMFGELSPEQKSSFLRFRGGLMNLTILAYDEVLERLKALRYALATVGPETSG